MYRLSEDKEHLETTYTNPFFRNKEIEAFWGFYGYGYTVN